MRIRHRKKPSIFSLRPRKLDVWTFTMRGRKVTKTVGRVSLKYGRLIFTSGGKGEWVSRRYPAVTFVRCSKGRYTTMRVRNLITNGQRIGKLSEINFSAHSGAAVKRELAKQNQKI